MTYIQRFKHILTILGGWWYTPKNYKSNAAIIGSFAFVISLAMLKFGSDRQFDATTEISEETMKKWTNAAAKGIK